MSCAKKVLAMVLCLIMCLSLLPSWALAEGPEQADAVLEISPAEEAPADNTSASPSEPTEIDADHDTEPATEMPAVTEDMQEKSVSEEVSEPIMDDESESPSDFTSETPDEPVQLTDQKTDSEDFENPEKNAAVTSGVSDNADGEENEELPVVEEAESKQEESSLLEDETAFELIPAASTSSGTCGDNLTWTLDETGALNIRGSGDMNNYSLWNEDQKAPWASMGDSVRKIAIENGVSSIGSAAFSCCSNSFSVTIPASVKSIHSSAFSGSGVTELIIQDGSQASIGYGAFAQCVNLTKLRIPEGVTEIDQDVFVSCSSLKTAGPIGGGYNYEFGWKTRIPDWAFKMAPIESVTIPETVTCIGGRAFYGCDKLKTVQLPAGLTTLETSAFNSCSSLTHIVIPATVTNIGNFVFDNCTGLKTAGPIGGGYNIEFGWTRFIPQYAFASSDLIEVIIPDGIEEIDDYVFLNNPELKSITIPSSVTYLGNLFSWWPTPESAVIHYIGTKKQWEKIEIEDSLPSTVTVVYEPTVLYQLDKKEIRLVPGEKAKIALLDLNTDQAVKTSWKTSDASCVTVDANGNITGVKLGSTAIVSTTSPDGKELSCIVHVIFSDVADDSQYYFDPVYWAVEYEITAGTSPTTFSPFNTCTRGQIVTFLWKAFGSQEPSSSSTMFTDVKSSDYFYKPVLWAKEKEITSGTSATTFSPGNPCTRGQIVTFLWKAFGSREPSSSSSPFTDVKSSDYFYKPVLWAVENGITSGTSPTTFSPGKACTRAQAMTFLYKAMH
ncbi:MAG: leucine-rich repeat protein [Lachnospiraceae bacterium]|nr:leucine-rich repeat protein [Lachnospiraceae bacterium]